MTDLDALTALLAAATTYCEQHMEMEHVNQIPPCAGARHEAEWWAEAFRLPALIEAARREAALRTLMEEITEKAITRDGYGRPMECRICFAGIDTFHQHHDASCPIPRAIEALGWPIPEPEPPSAAATARLPAYFQDALNLLLHDNAGTATPVTAEPE